MSREPAEQAKNEAVPQAGSPSDHPSDTTEALFAFSCDGIRLSVPAALVSQVIAFEPPTKVPRTPAHILGLLPYGEGSIAVLDTSRFLGLGPDPSESIDRSMFRSVIVRAGDLEAGLLCQHAHGVASIRTDDLAPPEETGRGRLREFLHATVPIGDERAGLLDLGRLLEAARARSRKEVG
jgi:purine-binding chemotaxis protein CheW